MIVREMFRMYEYQGKNVIIMLCSKCNINCKHCYIKYNGNFSLEELKKIFGKIKDKYFICLNGTEPILFPEYYELYKENSQSRILTNGLTLIRNPDLYDTLRENGINEIALSYHFGIQDDISTVKSSMLDDLIGSLVENGFQIKLMTTVSSDNYKMILTMCNKACELGAKTIKFTNYIYQGNAQKNDFKKVLNQEQINEVLSEIDYCRLLYKKEVLKIERCETFGPKQSRLDKFECLACNNMVVITPDLNVYQCVFDIDKGNEIGRVIDGKIMIDDEHKSLDKSYCKVLKKYNGIGGKQ